MYFYLGTVEKTPQNPKKGSPPTKNKLTSNKKLGSKSSPPQHNDSINIYGCSIPSALVLHLRDFVRRVLEWTRSLGMSEIGWDTLNVLGREMGKNLTNWYPDGKLLAESLEHMLDHLTGMRLICATEYFQYSSIINTLKSYTPQTKKKK